MRLSIVSTGRLVFAAAATGASSAFQTTTGPNFGAAVATARRRSTTTAPLSAAVDVQKTAERDLETVDNWATHYGIQKSDGFQLTSDDGKDWSVMTNTDIPANTPVVSVPGNLVLSSSAAYQEFGDSMAAGEDQLVQADLGYQVPLFRLFVKILVEYEQGEDSFYYPWLNSLPRIYNNGASMTYACFECLPPYAAWLSMKERVNFCNFHKALKFVHLKKDTVQDNCLVKWAYNVAVTRSLDVNGERVIAPMADMFNHGTETEVDYNFDDEGNCVMYTTRDVPAGSPLRMSLGNPADPSPLFATYGFLDESSPATFCKIMNMQQEMAELGVDFSRMLFYKDTGEIAPEVWDVVLYNVLGQNDESLKQGFYQAYTSGDTDTTGGYHQQYFPYTLEKLREHVDGTLRELDQLSAIAHKKDPSTHPRIPLILQHNAFVKSTFQTVKSQLDAM